VLEGPLFLPVSVSLTEPSGVIIPSCANTFTNAVVNIPAVAIKANARIEDVIAIEYSFNFILILVKYII
jgi:hypothetical protein